jgi:hypothetical protein
MVEEEKAAAAEKKEVAAESRAEKKEKMLDDTVKMLQKHLPVFSNEAPNKKRKLHRLPLPEWIKHQKHFFHVMKEIVNTICYKQEVEVQGWLQEDTVENQLGMLGEIGTAHGTFCEADIVNMDRVTESHRHFFEAQEIVTMAPEPFKP